MLRAVVAVGALLGLLLAPVRASAQPTQKLFSQSASGTITANGGTVEMQNAGGLGSLRIQTTSTSYSGTWEVQCSAAPTGVTPVYDSDDEVNLSLEGATSSPVQSVTDTQAIWTASIAGCTSVRVITTAWTSGTLTVYMYATTTGGGSSSGGGGASSSVTISEGGADAQVTATSGGSLQVECTSGCGAGASLADDADFTDGTTAGTPIGGVAESAAPTTVTEGDFGWAAITLNRALKTSLFNAGGTAAFGTAGTAATPVLTVQGIAAMTPLLATVSATDLDIQSGGADVLSTTAFNASLGTAGSADSQVQSIQGIASMTPVQVTNTTVASAGTYLTARLTDGSSFLQAATDVTEDAAETAGGTGPMVMTVRRDTAASSAGSNGDNATLNTDQLGRTWTRLGDPCANYARITTAAISTSSSGNVEIVALNGSDLIYVCGFSIVAGAATGVQLIYGTGTACATGETDLTGVWSFAANGGITQANAGVPQFVVPAGNAFCIENSGANAVAGHVTYVRTAAP